jgi:hypothetical protein
MHRAQHFCVVEQQRKDCVSTCSVGNTVMTWRDDSESSSSVSSVMCQHKPELVSRKGGDYVHHEH